MSPRRVRRPILVHAVVALALATSALAAGCSHGGVTVPDGAADLRPCPVRTIDVTALREMGEPGCNLEGSVLVFPNGREMTLGAPGWNGGATDSSSGEWVRAAAWGVPGVGAAYITGRNVTVWGSTPDAVDLQLQLLALEGIED